MDAFGLLDCNVVSAAITMVLVNVMTPSQASVTSPPVAMAARNASLVQLVITPDAFEERDWKLRTAKAAHAVTTKRRKDNNREIIERTEGVSSRHQTPNKLQ